MDDPTAPEEPRGAEPAALTEQAASAVARVSAAKWLPVGARVAEYGSPHGGSWLPLIENLGLSIAVDGEPADVVLDCFGLMHSPDQARAVAERTARVAPGGVLLLQFHSLATILRLGQWNSLRHGHYAYYSASALAGLLARVGFSLRMAWRFELYGGTVLVAATRDSDHRPVADGSITSLLDDEGTLRVRDPERARTLQRVADKSAQRLHGWLSDRRAAGAATFGYGAASRAVALLCRAAVDSDLLPGVADASPAKQGRRMPGTDVPVTSPEELLAASPDAVLLLLPDLMAEVRSSIPEVERSGGRWVDVETLSR